MANTRLSSSLYPKPTGDPGRDRNAQTLQISCFLLALVVGFITILDIAEHAPQTPLLLITTAALIGAALTNRAGRSDWAGRIVFGVVFVSAVLLVFQANDGIRSHAMLVFPGLLLISLMLMDRASYIATATAILVAVAALGVAEIHGLTLAKPGVRSPTSYDSILYLNLLLLVIALIGSRITRDSEKNAADLRAGIDRLSAANLELVRMKDHLEESEHRLTIAQRLAHVGSWHWNLGSNEVVYSEECSRIFGRREGSVPSLEGLLENIAPKDKERVAGEIQHGIAEKTGCSTEFQIIRPNGEERTVLFTSEVLLDDDGSPRHVVGACQDVTEGRRAQEEAIVRHKLETVGRLANGIAHDFNNLLGGVLSQAELALTELDDGVRPEEELQSICAVARSGSEIVRQLMIYTGQERGEPGAVDVAETVERMAELFKLSVSKRGALYTDLEKNLPLVRASGAQIRQIVMNLVMNASEALGEQNGEIRIIVRRVSVDRDRFPWVPQEFPAGEYAQLEVVDNGRGMTPETQSRIFDPFFTTKSLGHGLGLAVVSGIVRAIGGAIHLISQPGKGTCFEVLLPRAEATDHTSIDSASRDEPPAELRSSTALLVEDEEALRTAVAKLLRKRGLSVLEAEDGTSALAAIRGNDPIHLLLLDVTLPGTPSREVLAEARRLRPSMRVIVTTAYDEEFASSSLHTNVSRFIRKPYSSGDLLALIEEVMNHD
jgi:PAS domain S-box-containing protein